MFRDRVDVQTYEWTGEVDRYGGKIYEWVDHGTVPAELRPLGTDEQFSSTTDAVITRYKCYMAPRVELPADTTNLRILWRGKAFTLDGSVESHTIRAKLDHYEMIGALETMAQ